jgi:hypothetical protein
VSGRPARLPLRLPSSIALNRLEHEIRSRPHSTFMMLVRVQPYITSIPLTSTRTLASSELSIFMTGAHAHATPRHANARSYLCTLKRALIQFGFNVTNPHQQHVRRVLGQHRKIEAMSERTPGPVRPSTIESESVVLSTIVQDGDKHGQ